MTVLPRPPALVLGIPIADLTMDETLDAIGQLVELGRSTGRTHQITTVNLDFLRHALEQPELAAILREAALCLADGAPVVWSARASGMPIAERVAGSDLVPLLVDRSRASGWRIHCFGSAPDVSERAGELLRTRYPGATVTLDPGPKLDDPTAVDDAVIDSIRAHDPDILCVALGNPKQEWFIRANRSRLGVPVMIGIGGSLDMLVGHRRRAPVWMQRAGLEWVARAAQEPARLVPRYARDIRVVGPPMLREVVGRRRRSGAGLSIEIDDAAVHVADVDDGSTGADQWAAAAAALERSAHLSFVSRTHRPVATPALATAVGLRHLARLYGRSITATAGPGLVEQLTELGFEM